MRSASQPSENCDGEMLTEILIDGSQSREARRADRMICSDRRSITPISSAIGMKRSGGMMPAKRVAPARQHFEADDLAGQQVHLRFEEGQELFVLQPEANALLDLAVRNQRAFHRRNRTRSGAPMRPDWRGPARCRRGARGRGRWISDAPATAIPAKAPTWIILPSISNGRVVSRRSASTCFSASSRSWLEINLATANSSPPIRPMTELSPACSRIVPATPRSRHRPCHSRGGRRWSGSGEAAAIR